MTERKAKNLKKYCVKIMMLKPFEIVDFWPEKPDVDSAIEAFRDELIRVSDAEMREYFKVEVRCVKGASAKGLAES